ncbi:MAG: hypothetical protein QXI42_09675 [Thermoproteota archaeon]
MRSLRVKAAGTLLILLALSIELTPRLLFPRTLAQQEGYEDFLSRLENYLNNALPSESDPIKECEYIVPEGFNASYAERLWRFFASNVSRGCSEQDFRRALGSIYPNGTIPVEVNGSMVTLNLTGLRVEKPSDGSVKIRIPLVSNETLSYTYFNSTSVRIIYETWNETLVRYYRVKSLLPFLNVTYRSLDDNSIITRLIKPFLNTSVMLGNQTVTQGLSMEVTVPEHQQEILTLVPEHTEALRILFPAYTIRIIVFRNLTLPPGSNWEIEGEGSWWDVPVGNNFTIYYYVDWFHVDPEDEPLNAVLRVKPSSGFQAIGQDSARLTNSQPFGMFFLKATEKGLHNITLTLEGNAVFTDGSRETSVSIRIVGQEFPSISVSILNVDVSKPGCVRLEMSLRNTGGSRATSVRFLPVWHEWRDNPLQATGHIRNPIDLPDLEPGETYFFSYTYQVRHQHIIVFPDVWYVHRAPPAGTYWFRSLTWVPLNYTPPSPAGPAGEEYEEHVIAVPEHFEEEFVFIPARFARMNVTIPGYRRYVHISMQGVGVSVFEAMLRGLMNGVNGTVIPLLLGENLTYGVFAPLALSTPLLGFELSMGEQVEGEARYVMQSVERLFTDHGVLNETTVCGMLNVTREDLRHGRIPGEYNATLLCETWVKSRSLLMNASLFASYNLTVSKYIRDTGLQGELRIRWQRLTDASRFSKPSGETGFLTLIYRPLTVKGDGPLKSVQVRNYAGFNACYRLRVFRYDVAGFPAPVGQSLQPLWENFSSPFEVKRLSDTVILASSLAPTGQAYSVQLLYGSGIVAEAFFTLGVEQSPFWTGFWDGIKEKAWGIILTTAILVVLAIPIGGGTLLAEAKAYLTSTLIPQMMAASAAVNLIEIVEAYWAYDRLGKVVEALDGFSQKASNNGYVNASLFFRSLGDRVKEGRMLIAENTALDLLADLTVRDLFIVFGKGDATEYEKGRAWGRVVGTALSFLVYAYTYYRLFTDGPRLLSWRGKIKSFLRGVYNWVTPPLWDFGVALGSFAVDRVAASLYLSEQNQRFKEYLNLIRDDEASLSRVVEFTNGYLENALKISEGLGLSEKAFLGLLWAYGNTAKDLKEEDWSRFLTEIQDIGGDSRRFAEELLRWLYNAEDPLKIEQAVLEVAPRLADLSAGELENMGRALAKVGDSFENGFKLFNAYFDIPVRYGESVAEAVKKVFLRYVAEDGAPALSAWCSAVENGRIAVRCSGDRVYPRIPEGLAQAYGFEGGEPFTVIIKRGGEEYWVAGSMQKATTYVTPHEKMFENLGLTKGEYVELVPIKVGDASLFPALRLGAGRVDYHFSEKWDSVDGIWISQKGGEGIYLASCRRIGYLDEVGIFHSEPKATSYYVRKVELGGKLEFDVDDVAKEGYTPVYEIKAWKIGFAELRDAVRPLVEKGWVLFDEDTGRVRLAGFQEFGGRDFKYEGKIAADEKHHGGAQAVFVLNPGGENERALAVRIVANPATGELESRLDFSYDFKLGDWLDVAGLEKGIDNDGSTLFQIKHQFRVTAEETLWINTYMKWNPDSSCFKDAEIHIGSNFFQEGVEKWLKLDFEAEHVEANKIKLIVSEDMVKEYKSLFLEVKDSYEEHAKGLLGTKLINEFIIKNHPEYFCITDPNKVEVDETGQNLGNNWFDILERDLSTKKLFLAGECKLTCTESWSPDFKLEEAKKSLIERMNSREVQNAISEGWKLPENVYGFAMHITPDGIEVVWRIWNTNGLLRD